MELEFFCEPDTDFGVVCLLERVLHQLLKSLGMKEEEMRVRDHDQEELSFYSKATAILSSCSPSAGASCGVSQTVPITI